jgi:NAD(P)H-dependent flavin oxidoreductase YrpB (nitropropane dioxygenase family)
VDAGVDAIIAHGREADGHVRGEIGTPALVPVVNAVTPVPVLAAGGIADACDRSSPAQGRRLGSSNSATRATPRSR